MLNITYMDIGKVYLGTDGSISPSMMNDYLHPTHAGYDNCANMEEVLDELRAWPIANSQ